jgi:SAM-dependent methyltransferase
MNPSIYEQLYVTNVYDTIAREFSHTRHSIWHSVRDFIDSIPNVPSIKIADIGCGNGKNMSRRPKNFVGLDNSQIFVDVCRQKNLNAQLGSILDIPFDMNTFDYTLCIAVIHHLSTMERRSQAVKELIRITKPHGYILITVWSYESQASDQYHSKRLSESLSVNDSQQDRLVEWVGQTGNVCQRYYHFFAKNELVDLCQSMPEIEVIKSYEEHGNYCVILKKVC